MRNIEVKIMNPEAIAEAEKMMVFTARLTQRGHAIKTMEDLTDLYEKDYKLATAANMVNLPHPTIQKFGLINIAIVGASRRFLAQITRHQNEVKFMSASLQYSDYSDNADFCVPYEVIETKTEQGYINTQKKQMEAYMDAVDVVGHDAAGYLAPQGLRNILIISATPYQWKHMIGQRVCRRNTTETRYVMLEIWRQLNDINPVLFGDSAGPACCNGGCKEGKMCCMKPMKYLTPDAALYMDFPLLMEKVRTANE